jgi:hypothetical protein
MNRSSSAAPIAWLASLLTIKFVAGTLLILPFAASFFRVAWATQAAAGCLALWSIAALALLITACLGYDWGRLESLVFLSPKWNRFVVSAMVAAGCIIPLLAAKELQAAGKLFVPVAIFIMGAQFIGLWCPFARSEPADKPYA